MQATNGWGMKALGAGGNAVLSLCILGSWCFGGSLFAERARRVRPSHAAAARHTRIAHEHGGSSSAPRRSVVMARVTGAMGGATVGGGLEDDADMRIWRRQAQEGEPRLRPAPRGGLSVPQRECGCG
jgi:hypothetical protein